VNSHNVTFLSNLFGGFSDETFGRTDGHHLSIIRLLCKECIKGFIRIASFVCVCNTKRCCYHIQKLHGVSVRLLADLWGLFQLPPRPDRLWGPPSLPSNRYRRLNPRGMATHLHLVRRVIPPLPQHVFIAWCSGADGRILKWIFR